VQVAEVEQNNVGKDEGKVYLQKKEINHHRCTNHLYARYFCFELALMLKIFIYF
jgi:hypothetical protein